MAWTATLTSQFSNGNKIQQNWALTADAATTELLTGLSLVDHISVAPKSITTGAIKFKINVLSAATASLGTIAITGATSGDEMFLTVYGR